ncbi:hypothetical protein IFM89_017879 [Coptis chinensis]|uniref:Uncharacterized protein n=1 Tax=Coptis chinensis TaxID=261450 RepID=A0A835MIL3_9MAGN|nr:hypothetical protein IFM89_017879 [Coptis chinensis]
MCLLNSILDHQNCITTDLLWICIIGANGASFVMVDKTINPRDGCPALIIQDDGGGMDPESMCCISFGFSDKKSKSAIGQYGNGFKTSTMRLGADAIVFSRHTSNRFDCYLCLIES